MVQTLLTMLFAVIATVVYFVISRRRLTTHLRLDLEGLPPIDESLASFAGLTSAWVSRGNAAEVLQNGALFERMEADIRAAQHTVHLETFVWSGGRLEQRFVELLLEKAAQGVAVRLTIDAIGASEADTKQLRRLHEGRVRLSVYRAFRRFNLRRLNHRTHRKLLIVDGLVSYTFGHGIADQWLGEGQDRTHWRDTGVRLRGPVTHAMQSAFFQHWIEETREVPTGPGCFPPLPEEGAIDAHVVSSTAGDVISSVSLLYTMAIASARREIIIQNPYFIPGPDVVALLKTMVARGVTVHLMVPGHGTDSPFVRRAGCFLYAGLLESGVRLYEYQKTLLHQKVVIVDGVWSHIGSTNFDARSLALNEELGVGLLDENVAAELRRAFENDLAESREMSIELWKRRGWRRRAYEWMAFQVHEQL